nr:MAG TPA: hypothetical protein [Caudoviricetes sp.]
MLRKLTEKVIFNIHLQITPVFPPFPQILRAIKIFVIIL